MRDIALGQYYPASSVVHKMDPRAKLLISLVYLVTIFFVRSYLVYFAILCILLVCIALSKVPLRLVLKSLKPMLFLILFTAILNLFFGNLDNKIIEINIYFKKWQVNNIIFAWRRKAFKIGLSWLSIDNTLKMSLRLLFLILGPSLLTLTTTPVDLTSGMESLMKPLKAIRFPVHELTLIMSIALKFIPTIMEETDKIMMAQRARCADFDSGNIFKKARAMLPILIPLFVSSLRRAEELAYAMDSRCYRGSTGRTKLKKLHITWFDAVAMLLSVVLLFAVLVVRFRWLNAWFGLDLFIL